MFYLHILLLSCYVGPKRKTNMFGKTCEGCVVCIFLLGIRKAFQIILHVIEHATHEIVA